MLYLPEIYLKMRIKFSKNVFPSFGFSRRPHCSGMRPRFLLFFFFFFGRFCRPFFLERLLHFSGTYRRPHFSRMFRRTHVSGRFRRIHVLEFPVDPILELPVDAIFLELFVGPIFLNGFRDPMFL